MEVEPEKIKKTNRKEIAGKIEALLQIIDKKPKSFGWKTRAKVGTKKIWCEHVERPETADSEYGAPYSKKKVYRRLAHAKGTFSSRTLYKGFLGSCELLF